MVPWDFRHPFGIAMFIFVAMLVLWTLIFDIFRKIGDGRKNMSKKMFEICPKICPNIVF